MTNPSGPSGATDADDASPEFDQPMVWIDLEMTGLDPDHDLIVEIATIVTDGSLGQLVEGPDLVIHASDEVLDAMDEVVVAMHAGSGLTPLIRSSSLTVSEAEKQTLDFIQQYVPEPGIAPLAGNSVHADRAFMRRYMPELEAWLHYRNVDVSTLKELARRWDPPMVKRAPSKGGAHRALADIRESIGELAFYRDELFSAREEPASAEEP